MENPVLIFGAKNLGKIALDIFNSNEVVVYGFLEDDKNLHNKEIQSLVVFGDTENEDFLKLLGKTCEAFVAIDDSKERKFTVDMLKEQYKIVPVNALHKLAFVEASASLGHGNLIGAGAKILTEAVLGSHCLVQAGAMVDYGAKIGNFVEISTGAIIGAEVEIEDGAFVGAGAILIGGVKVGKNAKIGAGSVVIQSVKAGETVFGVPAKTIQKGDLG
jgi:sugar O-acyltransferase (sialic acid O-acetyltransferase NeuD family)